MIDAMDLDRIGRAVASEFTEVMSFDCGTRAVRTSTAISPLPVPPNATATVQRECRCPVDQPQPGRIDGERLVRVLDELGYEIRRVR